MTSTLQRLSAHNSKALLLSTLVAVVYILIAGTTLIPLAIHLALAFVLPARTTQQQFITASVLGMTATAAALAVTGSGCGLFGLMALAAYAVALPIAFNKRA